MQEVTAMVMQRRCS